MSQMMDEENYSNNSNNFSSEKGFMNANGDGVRDRRIVIRTYIQLLEIYKTRSEGQAFISRKQLCKENSH